MMVNVTFQILFELPEDYSITDAGNIAREKMEKLGFITARPYDIDGHSIAIYPEEVDKTNL